jgi:hypothetical protein
MKNMKLRRLLRVHLFYRGLPVVGKGEGMRRGGEKRE